MRTLDVILIILIILLIFAFAYTYSTNKVKGGYYHRVIFDEESQEVLNRFLRALNNRDDVRYSSTNLEKFQKQIENYEFEIVRDYIIKNIDISQNTELVNMAEEYMMSVVERKKKEIFDGHSLIGTNYIEELYKLFNMNILVLENISSEPTCDDIVYTKMLDGRSPFRLYYQHDELENTMKNLYGKCGYADKKKLDDYDSIVLRFNGLRKLIEENARFRELFSKTYPEFGNINSFIDSHCKLPEINKKMANILDGEIRSAMSLDHYATEYAKQIAINIEGKEKFGMDNVEEYDKTDALTWKNSLFYSMMMYYNSYAYENRRRNQYRKIPKVIEFPFSFEIGKDEKDDNLIPYKTTYDYSFYYGGINNGTARQLADNHLTIRQIDSNKLSMMKKYAKISDASFTVTYEEDHGLPAPTFSLDNIAYGYPPNDPRMTNYRYSIHLYKGMYNMDIRGKRRMGNVTPFKTLTVGYDYTIQDSRGSASGIGLYTTTNFEIAAHYCEDTIYVFECRYNRYAYTFFDIKMKEDVHDKIMNYLTDGYDPNYINFPSEKAIDLWCVLHPDNKELRKYIEGHYHTDVDMKINEIRERMISECPDISKMLNGEDLKSIRMDSDRNIKITEYYSYDLDVDIMVSYTHGSDQHSYASGHIDGVENSLSYYLLNRIPCYEIIPIRGGGVRVRDVLLLRER